MAFPYYLAPSTPIFNSVKIMKLEDFTDNKIIDFI